MLDFIWLFLAVLYVITGSIYNFRRKKYIASFVFLSVPLILHDFFIKHGILLLSGFVFISILIYIAIYMIEEIINFKSQENKSLQERRSLLKKEEWDSLIKKIKEYKEEMDLINSDKMPTDEDIELYYKMYLKKWELDNEDEWLTDNIQPYTFEEWKGRARIQRYYFLISQTCDIFMGFPPNTQMIRMRDYKKIVESEK